MDELSIRWLKGTGKYICLVWWAVSANILLVRYERFLRTNYEPYQLNYYHKKICLYPI
jgi:hypothetical protein